MAKWLVLLLVLCVCAPAAAQDVRDDGSADRASAPLSRPLEVQVPTARRPAALVPLYISFGALQAADLHSTLRALDAGGREANPLMGGIAGSPGAMIAVKAAASAATIVAVEHLRKKHRVAAVVTMVALNTLYATLAVHNYSVAGRR
jgi:hypothetical protein